MKVLWAHNFDSSCVGSGGFMHTLADSVAKRGIDLHLHYLGNLRRPLNVFATIHRLKRQSREFDIIHAQFGSACGYLVSLAPGRKVLTLRGSDWYRLKRGQLAHRLHGFMANSLTLRSIRDYARIIVMSERMKREVDEIVPSSLVHVIPDGIDLAKFAPMERRDARLKLGIDPDVNWVLFSSLLSSNPIKRVALAKSAIESACRVIPNTRILVASGISHGEMPLYMNAASVVLMTSAHEGWPNTIKEALACNTPFVSTDVSDLHMIAAREPSCAVTEAYPEALGRALICAISAERSATLSRQVEGMSADASATAIISLYQSLT